MIELGMMPNTSIKLVNREVDKRNDIPEIPTVFSQTRELFQGVQNLPVKKTIDSLNNVLSELENNLPVILPALAHTSQNLEKITNEISPVTEETVNNLNETLTSLTDTLKSIKNLTDYLEQHPESILRGKE